MTTYPHHLDTIASDMGTDWDTVTRLFRLIAEDDAYANDDCDVSDAGRAEMILLHAEESEARRSVEGAWLLLLKSATAAGVDSGLISLTPGSLPGSEGRMPWMLHTHLDNWHDRSLGETPQEVEVALASMRYAFELAAAVQS